MKSGSKKRLSDQQNFMAKFFHGRPPNHPSQIQLLTDGRVVYSDLYEEVELSATKKKDDSTTVKRLQLKKSLLHDGRTYYSGTDIRVEDLEKKNLTGSVIIGGQNVLDLSIKGARGYKKDLAFNAHKWDSVRMQSKHYGDSVEDCIDYFRREMYKAGLKPKGGDESEADSESEDVIDEEVIENTPVNVNMSSSDSGPRTSETEAIAFPIITNNTEEDPVMSDNDQSHVENDNVGTNKNNIVSYPYF